MGGKTHPEQPRCNIILEGLRVNCLVGVKPVWSIADSFASVGAGMGLRQVVVTGGRDTVRQSQDLDRRPHVVVATPGRLADHIRNNSTLSLARVKYLVLDEADRLLSGANLSFQLSRSSNLCNGSCSSNKLSKTSLRDYIL